MTDFAVKWIAAWDAIVVEAKKVTEFSSRIYQTDKRTPGAVPVAYVLPGIVDITPATNVASYYVMNFVVEILVRNPDLKAGLQAAMELAAKVHDTIKDDRTLGGVVDKTEMRILPDVKRSQLENAWANLLVQCTYMGI